MQRDDVMLNKAAIIERCIRRVREEHADDPELRDATHTDALTLNVERACQACIDLAMHVVASRRLGVPQSSGEAFALLHKAGLIDERLARSLHGMTGFRNIAIHEYQELDKGVLSWIVRDGWNDWIALGRAVGLRIEP